MTQCYLFVSPQIALAQLLQSPGHDWVVALTPSFHFLALPIGTAQNAIFGALPISESILTLIAIDGLESLLAILLSVSVIEIRNYVLLQEVTLIKIAV